MSHHHPNPITYSSRLLRGESEVTDDDDTASIPSAK
jgi:hypothetical protein